MPSDHRVLVPESPVAMTRGFLTEYWRARDPLPQMTGIDRLKYFIQRGVQTITALPLSNCIAIATIAVSLFMLSGFLLLVENVGRLLTDAGTSLQLSAYIKEGAEEGHVEDFIREIENNPRVRSVEFISKDQALEIFRRDFASRSTLLAGLEEENPLPASVEIVLQPDELGIGSVNRTIEQLRRKEVIDDVIYGSEWADRMRGLVHVFRVFGAIVLGVAAVITVALMASTIKLVIYSRRDEVAIMKLVGASDTFIKVPFIIGGLLQGFAGACAALLLLRIGFYFIKLELETVVAFGFSVPQVEFLTAASTALVLTLGLVVGAVGTSFALGRSLEV